MYVTIGLVSILYGSRKAIGKEFKTKEEANAGIEKMMKKVMDMHWMPTYATVDGVNCMTTELGDTEFPIYTIEMK